MLLDLTRPALASQSRQFILVKQFHDDVLAGPGQTESSVHHAG